eukprot:851166-Rhodomonas_salina.1
MNLAPPGFAPRRSAPQRLAPQNQSERSRASLLSSPSGSRSRGELFMVHGLESWRAVHAVHGRESRRAIQHSRLESW